LLFVFSVRLQEAEKQVALLTKELELKQQQVRSSYLLVPDLALFHFGCLVADITST
jgi:hypothetical protein